MTVAIDVPIERRICHANQTAYSRMDSPYCWSPSEESPMVFWIAIDSNLEFSPLYKPWEKSVEISAGTALDEAYEKIGAISSFWETSERCSEVFSPSLANSELILRSGVYPVGESDTMENADDENDYRGFQPLNRLHTVLFSELVEIRPSELRRWKPSVTSFLDFDDDE